MHAVDSTIVDGTWTIRCLPRTPDVWRGLVLRSWIRDERFQRARLVLDGGPVVFASAQDLRAVAAASSSPERSWLTIRLELSGSRINGTAVELQREA